VIGRWRKLHYLYFLPGIHVIRLIKSRSIKWEGHLARIEMQHTYRTLVEKAEGNRPLERLYRWVDNIKMDLGEI
jgi:hypothetical protein